MNTSFPGLAEHFRIALRLYARNRLALFYSYLFPVIFFAAFLVLYRHERPALMGHMGELLTVAILGGACFGLPTSLVSERERGVWRRYRLVPVATGGLVASTFLARYVMLLGAGGIQLLLAMAIGGWWPAHPLELWFVFSLVCFAMLGLGLVLASLADTVPAVQALGQCLFLPMLVIGGVAVRLEILPDWAIAVSAFFPGRYAVEAIQECVTGGGLAPVAFPLVAIFLIGAAACLAGARLFRWDGQKRVRSGRRTAWVGVALTAWIAVGAWATQRGEVAPRRAGRPLPGAVSAPADPPAANPGSADAGPGGVPRPASESAPGAGDGAASSGAGSDTASASTKTWRSLTAFDFAALPIAEMPSDEGNISPIAAEGESAAGSSARLLKQIEEALPTWAPGHVGDPVQRVRNYLYIMGAADFGQSPLERFLPGVVLNHMLKEFKAEELAQLLCWVALHPEDGDHSALNDPLLTELNASGLNPAEVRNRTYFYGVKLTRWVLGW